MPTDLDLQSRAIRDRLHARIDAAALTALGQLRALAAAHSAAMAGKNFARSLGQRLRRARERANDQP
jgi:hypothetical protein